MNHDRVDSKAAWAKTLLERVWNGFRRLVGRGGPPLGHGSPEGPRRFRWIPLPGGLIMGLETVDQSTDQPESRFDPGRVADHLGKTVLSGAQIWTRVRQTDWEESPDSRSDHLIYLGQKAGSFSPRALSKPQ